MVRNRARVSQALSVRLCGTEDHLAWGPPRRRVCAGGAPLTRVLPRTDCASALPEGRSSQCSRSSRLAQEPTLTTGIDREHLALLKAALRLSGHLIPKVGLIPDLGLPGTQPVAATPKTFLKRLWCACGATVARLRLCQTCKELGTQAPQTPGTQPQGYGTRPVGSSPCQASGPRACSEIGTRL